MTTARDYRTQLDRILRETDKATVMNGYSNAHTNSNYMYLYMYIYELLMRKGWFFIREKFALYRDFHLPVCLQTRKLYVFYAIAVNTMQGKEREYAQ